MAPAPVTPEVEALCLVIVSPSPSLAGVTAGIASVLSLSGPSTSVASDRMPVATLVRADLDRGEGSTMEFTKVRPFAGAGVVIVVVVFDDGLV